MTDRTDRHGDLAALDVSKVRPKRDPGYCYLRAGFVADGSTKGGLLALRLAPEKFPPPATLTSIAQQPLF